MFRNTRDGGRNILSTSGNGHGGGDGGGGSMHGAARTSKPAISTSFVATIFWALLSLGLMAGGWTFSGLRRLESSTMKCDVRGCKLTELTDGVTNFLTIPRRNMIRGELVRVKNGAIVNPSKMIKSAQRKLGHTYAVVYTEPDFEDDDDDSYDSYDDDQDSSEDDDEDDDRARGAGKPGQRPNAPPAKKPTVTSAKSSKSVPKPPSEEEKKAAADRKEAARKAAFDKKAAQRALFAEERRSLVKEPVREPDEQQARRPVRREAAQHPMDDDDDYDREARFPGDAGTMREKNRDEIARMEAGQEMAARDHRGRSQKDFEELINKRKADRQTRKMGNNLRNRNKLSPDDPDRRQAPPKVEQKEDERPKLERREAPKDLSNRVKVLHTPAARSTREEIDRDAAESRVAHSRGHGHHQKSAKEVAATVDDEVGAKVVEKRARHHHKAFHHKNEVPAEQRHHVHPGFHHPAGEKKIEHGWKHQNSQWHGRGELKKLGTSYNLGRSKSRERKAAIDSYVSRRSHKVDFVDSNKWSVVGPYMMMIVGFISASFCLIFGNFRPKFSSRQTGVSSLEESLLTPEDRVEK